MRKFEKRTRTIEEARAFLAERYEEQNLKFPLGRDIPKDVYIRVNECSALVYFVEVA